jgi:predicted nucleic acid-binding protein
LGFIFDTSPLITAASFKLKQGFILNYLLEVIEIHIVQTVLVESTINPLHSDAKVIQTLVDHKKIINHSVPQSYQDRIVAEYSKLGLGEQDSIRLSISSPKSTLVLDDFLAFVVASRFDIKCTLLLDLFPNLVRQGKMEVLAAEQIVKQLAPRYSVPFVSHTLYKLKDLDQ